MANDPICSPSPSFFPWVPVFLGVGIYIYFHFEKEPSLLRLVLLMLASSFCFFLVHKSPKIPYQHLVKKPLLCLILITLGLVSGRCSTLIKGRELLKKEIPIATLSGTVIKKDLKIKDQTKTPIRNHKSCRITLDIAHPQLSQSSYPSYHTLINLKRVILMAPLDFCDKIPLQSLLKAEVTLRPIPYPTTLYGYHLRRTLFFQGIGAYASLHLLTSMTPPLSSSFQGIQHIREHLNETLLKLLPAPESGIAMALTTGVTSHIPDSLRQSFADAGIAHILAISGLHMGLVVFCVFSTLCFLIIFWPRYRARYPSTYIAIPLSLAIGMVYMALSGFGYPVIRAFCMICFFMGAIMLKRRSLSLHSLALAATLILLILPESLLNISFQLSFAAVLGLVWGYEMISVHFKNHAPSLLHKVALYGVHLTISTVLATLFTLPFIMETFQRITLTSLLGNFLAIPLTGLWIMPNALLCLLTLPFFESSFLFDMWQHSLSLLITIARKVSSLPGSDLMISKPAPYFLPLMISTGLFITLLRGRYRLLGGIPLGSFIILHILFPKTPPDLMISKTTMAYRRGDDLIFLISSSPFEEKVWKKDFNLKNTYVSKESHYSTNRYIFTKNPYKISKKLLKKHKIITPLFFKEGFLSKKDLESRGTCFTWVQKGDTVCTNDHHMSRPWA